MIKFYPESGQFLDQVIKATGKSYKRLRGDSRIIRLRLKDSLDFNATLNILRQFDSVIEWVEPNYLVTRASAENRQDSSGWGREPAGIATSQTIIAVIDTGLATGSSAGSSAGSSDGWNFIDDSNDVRDDHGHGTQVSGIISRQIRKLPAIKLLALKALDKNGSGTIADVIEAIDYAIAHSSAVINCSFGTPAFSRAMIEAIERAASAGVLVVAAAGNGGQDLARNPFYPASYQTSNLISVAATDGAGMLANFSNSNAQIAAPGVNILTRHRDGRGVRLSGTSAAAASVSAVAARLKSARGWASPQLIRQSLTNGSRKTFSLAGKVASGGLLDAIGALSTLTAGSKGVVTRTARAKARALQSGATLDFMRANQPQAPAPYSPSGTLPPAGYDDPKPTITAYYNNYLTQLTRDNNPSGPVGSLPLQAADPTTGDSTVGGLTADVYHGQFNFTAPILSLAGRAGLGVSLALSYSSKVWIKDTATNTMVFNTDRGFPAPGWRVGFGAIQAADQTGAPYLNNVTGKSSYIYLAPDGTRHDLAFNSTSGHYESYNSTYLSFDSNQQLLRTPSGSQIKFGAYSYSPSTRDYHALPVQIKDRNGNYIDIFYRTLDNQKVVIDYFIDTAGRRVDFGYQNNRLIWIGQNRGGNWFYFARVDYQPLTIQTNFPLLSTDPPSINGTQVYLPVRISYPTGVNLRFTYTSYGQVSAIRKWVPQITGQGAERMIAQTSFNFPSGTGSEQNDCPKFSSRGEWAENWQGGATQYYSYIDSGYGIDVSDPNLRTFRVNLTGLTHKVELYSPDGSTYYSKQDKVIYEQDAGLSYRSNPRPVETTVASFTDFSPVIRKTRFSYIQRDGMWLPNIRDDYGELGTNIYRRTITDYTSYPAQRVLGLPAQVSVYAGPGTTLVAQSTNVYDQTGSYTDSNGQNAPYFIDATGDGVIQHDNTNYGSSFTARGNLTGITQYSVVNGSVTGSRTIKRLSYDTNGNLRAEADGAANRKQILYADYYTNKPGGVGQTHLYPYTAADPTGFRAGAQREYYAGLSIKSFNLRPGSSTEEQIVTTSYDFADRPLQTTRPDGGYLRTAYWDNWLAVTTSQLIDAGKIRFKFEEFDGAGRARRKATDHPDGIAGKFAGRILVLDKIGQVTDSSNLIAIYGDWTPRDEDAPTGFLFTHLTYDELRRLKVITHPDNNSRSYSYDGCGCAGSTETRVTDELGHDTVSKTDFLGRLIEAYEPGLSPTDAYSRAIYIYDELDRLKEIRHSDSSGAKIQTRTFSYDGYGRLQNETTPEGGALSYTYKPNDLIETRSDQRGVVVSYGYNTRNLITSLSYNDATPAVSIGYDQFGSRQSMSDGEGQTTYSFNNFRQLESETRTFNGLPGKSYLLSYTYNLADQLKSVNYNIPTQFNMTINYGHNSVGALSGVGTNLIGGDSTTNVINSLAFKGWGAIRSLNYGNGRRLQMGYSPQRRQPTRMTVDRTNGTDKIIDNIYDYYDGNGNNNNRIRKITDLVDPAYTMEYAYDDYNRLTNANAGPIGAGATYTRFYLHDAWGNIRNFNGVTFNYQTNPSGAPASNRIASDSTGATFAYDNAGNLNSSPGWTFTYDGANRLKQAAGSSGTSTYGYDGDGMRVRQTAGGNPLYYVRSSVLGQVVMEVNTQGAYRAYVYSGSKLLALRSHDGNFYWLHTNHLGSARWLTDASGVAVYRGEFDPYGQTVFEYVATSSLNSRKFTGYERDSATGLDYANARMYNSGRGRFMQADPMGLKAARLSRPQSLNRYSYVENDPVNYVDPGGMFGILWTCHAETYTDPEGRIFFTGREICEGEDLGLGTILGDPEPWESQETCPVDPLEEITDPVARNFENGQTIDTENLTEATRNALNCLQTAVQNAGGTFTLTSAYRPEAYQAHLREVWDKWQLLRNNRSPACRRIREEVRSEWERHGMVRRPALRSRHTEGLAFDATITLPEGRDVDRLAADCNLYRPERQTDPVHFTIRD